MMIFGNKNNVNDCVTTDFILVMDFFLMKMSFGAIENILLVPKNAACNQSV